tara:strand:+ start:844 stop:2703 length:1860 start_codon:yes stop_codon:yes gene_type:complete
MNLKLITSVFLALWLSSCSVPKSDLESDDSSVRNTQNGKVIGGFNDKTHQWLGIQYGSIPSSEFRWKKAKAPDDWEGIKESLNFGATCAQKGSLINTVKRKEWRDMVGSEDCLYLNVWAPQMSQEELSNSSPLPVMVWIHGGSNVSGNADFYDPSELAYQHNLIVVTINYRLGPFGWFSHPSIKELSVDPMNASGNYGNIDTIQSLEWVQSNIANFGGDPTNITIFGESAGGYNVAALLSSPIAEGLFHKAIIQSGGIKPGDITHAESYLKDNLPWKNYTSKELVNQLLIERDYAQTREEALSLQIDMNDEAINDLLRSSSTEEIYVSFQEARFNTNEMLRPFPDGIVLDQNGILNSLKNGFSANIPIIFGTNRDEMKLFLMTNPRLVRSFLGLPRIRNIETWNSVVSHRSNTWKFLAVDQPARELSLIGRKNVYAYRFDWDDEPRKFGVNLSDLLGAAHAFEIPFVMGNFEEDTLTKYILSRKNMEEVKNLSNTMMSYWAEFAYTGAPGKGRKGNQIEWRSWDEISPENSKYIIFDSKTDRGIRMTSNAITKESLFASIEKDENIDFKMKCEMVDSAIKFDNVENESWLYQFADGLCSDLDPDSEWRQFWYDELDKPY